MYTLYYKDYIGIIGSGIAGLSLGFELSRRGHKCLIIDSPSPERASDLGQGLITLKGINTPRELLFKMKFESLSRVKKWLGDIESVSGQKIPIIDGVYQPIFLSIFTECYKHLNCLGLGLKNPKT